MIKLIDILKEVNADHKQATIEFVQATDHDPKVEEISLKKAAAIGAMGLATLGSPKGASGQNFKNLKDKFKAGVTAVQNKINPQQKTVSYTKTQTAPTKQK